jgi:LacI family transcriptional regulator, repressor for deo operon, udp, cdd, tsx, nupC, and nupG
VARAAEFAVLLSNSNGDPEREETCFDQVVRGRADGIILLTGVVPTAYAAGKRPWPPLVTVLEPIAHPAAPVIRTDHRSGAAQATQHLLGLGHRRIAHIAGSERVASTAQRRDGFCAALTAAGVQLREALLYSGDFTMHSGAVGMRQLLALDEPPTAVLCANDEMAFGAIRTAREAGLRVPDDLSVVGFDDLNLAAFYNPPLTSVHIPRHELGRRAARALIDQLEGHHVPDEVVLGTRLMVRQSTAPVRVYADSGRRR